MNDQKTIIPLSEKVTFILDKIEKKYKLGESDNELMQIIEKNGLPKISILADLARDLVLEKISSKEFLDGLQKNLGLSKEQTKNLAMDIINKLVPLLKSFTQEEIKNYRSSPEQTVLEESKIKSPAKLTAQELLIEKIRGGGSTEKETQKTEDRRQSAEELDEKFGVKKVEVEDVEESAERLKKQREERAKQGTTGGAIRKGQPDPYRETTE